MTYKKKLIEVALPLQIINTESAREKNIRHGHPSTFHLWWARRPLAACRAVIWASLIDDPSSQPEKFPSAGEQENERKRLFSVLESIIHWDDAHNPSRIQSAKEELKALVGELPPILDPFTGGGTIPYEAQRLGLKAVANDLNPVACLINKAMLDFPHRFEGVRAISSDNENSVLSNQGFLGISEDVKHYARVLKDRVYAKVKDYYPSVKVVKGKNTVELFPAAWLWARTVTCPNPACRATTPLLKSFNISTKRSTEHHLHPIIKKRSVEFEIKKGKSRATQGTMGRAGTSCLVCGESISLEYIRAEGQAKRLGTYGTAVVVDTADGRGFFSFSNDYPTIPEVDLSFLEPDLSTHPQYMSAPRYGYTRHVDLYTKRQAFTLAMFCQELESLFEEIKANAIKEFKSIGEPLRLGGAGGLAYSEMIKVFLAISIDKTVARNNALCPWEAPMNRLAHAFGMQTVSIKWDFAEANPFAGAGGDFLGAVNSLCEVIEAIPSAPPAEVLNGSATTVKFSSPVVVCTDPPYYDNVPYADLSDIFYVWLRRNLKSEFPEVFKTLLAPKSEELVADQYRHGSRSEAKSFFEEGLKQTFANILNIQDRRFPITVFYAFKQSEGSEDDDGTASTGWETVLEGMISSGLMICGTWPIRTEQPKRLRDRLSNALASSIVLVCRPRPDSALTVSRRQFVQQLKAELPGAIRNLLTSGIAAVDLQQSAIGPGISVFSRYAKVLEADDSTMSVHSALVVINQVLDEVLAQADSNFDSITRWAIAWFEQYGFDAGPFGEANTLSQAKNVSVAGLTNSGIVTARAGRVSLIKKDGLEDDWTPVEGTPVPVWLATMHLIHALEISGESAAGGLLRLLGATGSACIELAYRCYALCEKKGWAQEAILFNNLVTSWSEIQKQALNHQGTQTILEI